MDNYPPGPDGISPFTRPPPGPTTVTRQAYSTMQRGELVLFREPVPRPHFFDRSSPTRTNRVSPEYGPWTEGTINGVSQHGVTIKHNTRQGRLQENFIFIDEDHYANQIRRFKFDQPETPGVYDI